MPISKHDQQFLKEMLTPPNGSSAFNERSTFSWPLVVTLVGLAISGAGMGAIAKAAGNDAGTALVENKRQDEKITALQIQAAENTAEHKAIRELLLEIKSDIKDVKAEIKRK